MIVISDTNILSSLASGDSLDILSQLFARSKICIPPAVHAELQVGLTKGRTHLESALQAIAAHELEVLPLSAQEQYVSQSLPLSLNAGEREAIALAQSRKAPLLSNDKKAVRYCQQQGIRAIDLSDILRLLWTRHIMSQDEVKALIEAMARIEKLTLNQAQRAIIFAPRHRKPRTSDR